MLNRAKGRYFIKTPVRGLFVVLGEYLVVGGVVFSSSWSSSSPSAEYARSLGVYREKGMFLSGRNELGLREEVLSRRRCKLQWKKRQKKKRESDPQAILVGEGLTWQHSTPYWRDFGPNLAVAGADAEDTSFLLLGDGLWSQLSCS